MRRYALFVALIGTLLSMVALLVHLGVERGSADPTPASGVPAAQREPPLSSDGTQSSVSGTASPDDSRLDVLEVRILHAGTRQPLPATVSLIREVASSGWQVLHSQAAPLGTATITAPNDRECCRLYASAEGFSPRCVGLGPGSQQEVELSLLPDRDACISGLVSMESGRPGSGALVLLVPAVDVLSTGQPPERATADELGAFAVLDLRYPRYLVRVVLGNEYFDSESVVPPGAAPLAIRLRAARELAGKVIDPAGNPVPLAAVQCRGLPPCTAFSTTSTNDRGEFIAHGLRPESYEVHASHVGFLPSASRVVSLDEGNVDAIELQVLAGLSITGIVQDEAGNPVAGGWVMAIRDEGDRVEFESAQANPALRELLTVKQKVTGNVGADGGFEVAPLAPSSVVAIRYLGASYRQDPNTVERRFTAGAAGVALRVLALTELSILVLGDADEPLQGASVAISSAGKSERDALIRRARDTVSLTDGDGSVSFSGLAEGAYYASVTRPGYASRRVLVMIVRGELSASVAVSLRSGCVTGGTVRDQYGEPVAEAIVTLTPVADARTEMIPGRERTNSNGAFSIGATECGQVYRIVVRRPDGVRNENILSTWDQVVGGGSVDVIIGQSATLEVSVSPAPPESVTEVVHAWLLDDGEQPPRLLRRSKKLLSSAGLLEFEGIKRVPTRLVLTRAGFAPVAVPVPAPVDGVSDAGCAFMDAGVTLTGRVVDGDGAAVAGAQVSVPFVEPVFTDAGGAFSIPCVGSSCSRLEVTVGSLEAPLVTEIGDGSSLFQLDWQITLGN